MRTVPLAAVVVCLIGSAAAQQAIQNEAGFFSPWPGGEIPQFQRAAIGHLGDDGLPDAVVVRDLSGGTTEAFYLPNVHRFNAKYPVGTKPARDAAILPQAAPDDRDAVLALTDNGLELHWAATGQALQLVATETSTAWQSAQRVWGLRSQDGTHWILGLDASGTQMLRLTWNGVSFVSQSSFLVAAGLSDVQSLDYNGAGEHELLLWTDPWAVITSWDGVVLEAVNTDISPNAPAPLPFRRSAVVSRGQGGTGNPVERDLVVLHVYWDVTGDYYAVPFNSDVAPYMIPLSGVAANHQSAADVDGDGLQDVLLSRSDRSEVFVLRRTNDPVPFATTGAPNRMPLVVPDGVQDQALDFSIGGDFDADGDTDVLAFQSAFGHVHSFYGSVVSGRRPHASAPWQAILAPGTLTWEVQQPDDWSAIVNDNVAGELRIRVEGWVQLTSNSTFQSVRRIDVSVPAQFSQAGQQSISITYDPTGLVAGDYVLHVHTSIERVDNGAVTKSYPSSLTYYTPNIPYASQLFRETVFETTGFTNIPGDGDGSVEGNRSNKPPPDPPPQ